MKLAIFPHNDDEALFCAYTLMREKPLVMIVTDAYIQDLRGEKGCDAETRWEETKAAMDVLGCAVMRLGIQDNMLSINEEKFTDLLKKCVSGFDTVYIPALQGGNYHHDIVHRACREVFGDKCVEYTTYSPTELYTTGNTEVIPTPEEIELKDKALDCYTSQIELPATRPHFDAVRGKSEWLNK